MWSLVERLWSRRQPADRLLVESETSTALTLRHGSQRMVFDRLTRAVTQQGRQISTFGNLQRVLVRQSAKDDGSPVWLVALQLKGPREEVAVGRAKDADEAAAAATRIAAVTGTQVKTQATP
jgi:hypothetical protein